jgi:hypothetical protein
MSQRVARGRVFQVDNMDRKFGENLTYNFVFFEDTRDDKGRTCEDGEQLPTEYPLLFTDNEIQVARQRALRNKEDLLEKDFLTDLTDDLF